MSSHQHFTTRRSFIAAMGFGGVSLYGLWAAYGAAPTPAALLGIGDHQYPEEPGGHAGHGAAAHGPEVDEFRRLTAEFVARYRMADGRVYPRLIAEPAHEGHSGTHGGGHSLSHGAAAHGSDQGHGAHAAAPSDHAEGHAAPVEATLDVYLLAEKWFYEPAHLRLDVGVPYRFRMMAADVAHGASVQLGHGGRMVRLRPGRVSELQATFKAPGTHLVYCTVYCGHAHDSMQARIDVI
ncbi:MAG: hypothetical protein KJZ80_05955 [Hyphomicrobiaceae bacterium]|nr:hypothetical protein [Hyphomicrobiaceae bacterium]